MLSLSLFVFVRLMSILPTFFFYNQEFVSTQLLVQQPDSTKMLRGRGKQAQGVSLKITIICFIQFIHKYTVL